MRQLAFANYAYSQLADSSSRSRMTPSTVVVVASYYYYYATFNAPCVGHRDDESQAQAMIGLLRRTLLWHFKCQIYAHKAEVQSMNNEHENTPHSAYIFSVPVASVGAGIRELTRLQKNLSTTRRHVQPLKQQRMDGLFIALRRRRDESAVDKTDRRWLSAVQRPS